MALYRFTIQTTPHTQPIITERPDDASAISAGELIAKQWDCNVMVTKNPWRGQPGRLVKIVEVN